MNLGEIRRQALNMVRDLAGDAASPIEVDQLINRGLLEFCDRSDYLRDSALIELVSGQADYQLPEAVLRVVRVSVGERRILPVSYLELDARNCDWSTEVGEPTHYLRDLVGHAKLRLYPIPSSDGMVFNQVEFEADQEEGAPVGFTLIPTTVNQESGIIVSLEGVEDLEWVMRVDFIRYPATLAADDGTPEIPRQYHDCLSAYAAGHLLTRNGEPERAAPHLAEFEAQLKKAKGEAAQTFQPSHTRRVRPQYF